MDGVTEEELLNLDRLYGNDVKDVDLQPDDLLAYENQHRAHMRALIAEVRLAHVLIRDYVDALSKPRLPNGDGQRVTCVVCDEWLDVRHSSQCPGRRMAQFYRDRFPLGITQS